jgi:Spy/CpxP family protein refolding chaperone
MRKALLITLLASCLCLGAAVAAQPKSDVFKGKLFPPNVILQHQDELGLGKEQFTAIKAAVVEVQANVAEHEWDMREAYLSVMSALDESPVDEDKIMALVSNVLLAENEVKKEQMRMLIRLRNLLTDEQVAYLERQHAKRKVE